MESFDKGQKIFIDCRSLNRRIQNRANKPKETIIQFSAYCLLYMMDYWKLPLFDSINSQSDDSKIIGCHPSFFSQRNCLNAVSRIFPSNS